MFALCAGCHEQAYQGADRTHPWTCPDCQSDTVILARLVEDTE